MELDCYLTEVEGNMTIISIAACCWLNVWKNFSHVSYNVAHHVHSSYLPFSLKSKRCTFLTK